jgi:hypothetical protein
MGKLISACITVAIALGGLASAPALDVGEHLPALGPVTWLGDAVDPTGSFAVIDLWSPDNPACRATMPRLTDLQRRHPEVKIVGLAAGDPSLTEQFVKSMGSRVGYAIGVVPSLEPFAPPVGAPIAVLVDRSGTVLWWGDATEVAQPLAEALGGTFIPTPPMVQPPLAAPPVEAPPMAPAPSSYAPQPAPLAPPPPTPERHSSTSVSVSVAVPFVWWWPFYAPYHSHYHDSHYHDHYHH